MNHKMQRGGAPRQQQQQPQQNDEVIRLRRLVGQLVKKNARKDAAATIQQLKSEGIVFGRNAQEAQRAEAANLEFLSSLNDQDRETFVDNVIRRSFARRANDPTAQSFGGVTQFSRRPDNVIADAEDDAGPQTAEEASLLASIMLSQKLNPEDAVKFMRKKQAEHDARTNGYSGRR
jgi:hypothetical protein